jgi:uncharacterized protein (TIGR01319 family)
VTLAVCADVGSTFTKVTAVDTNHGTVLAGAETRTTVDSDVLRGLDAAIGAATAGHDIGSVDVCSSAGGGLRLAVVGYEQLVTAQAGHWVGLSAGARVVHVAAGALAAPDLSAVRASRPDVVLLVGGTDGGDVEVLTHNAISLAEARWGIPVVVAGNADGRAAALAALTAAGVPAVGTDNVLPRIGELRPQPARAAIRDVFLRHVIGGKNLSAGPRFASLVRGATPDVVLTAVELLAEQIGGDLLVVDIGGATTDVYSVVRPDADDRPDVAGTLPVSRTVEGDLGLRVNAAGVVAAAVAERLVEIGEEEPLLAAAQLRVQDPAYLPVTDDDHRAEIRIAQLAAMIAVRRHARGDGSRTATDRPAGRRDLRRVRLLLGSGGVLRHARPARAATVLDAVLADHAGGWPLPLAAAASVDRGYLLAPAGLLATRHPDLARALLRQLT